VAKKETERLWRTFISRFKVLEVKGGVEVVVFSGFWRRAAATILDGIIVGIPVAIVLGLLFGFNPDPLSSDGVLSQIFNAVILLVYKVAMEASVKQATIGKMIMKIVVTDYNGGRISVLRAIGRYFASFLSALIIGIGYLMVAFTPKKQGLHDYMASTLVVKK
jgi:uncharacterized RDD family membrane protein YckC